MSFGAEGADIVVLSL